MRSPDRRFKDRPSTADHGSMVPGGSGRARPFVPGPFVVAVLSTTLLLTLAPTAATAGPYAGGEAGTGVPSLHGNAPRVASRSAVRWSDVTSAHTWAREAIEFVAGERRWMRDFRTDDDGRLIFRPDARTKRKHFARAIVRAFGGAEDPDPRVSFSDLDEGDAYWPFANVAVAKGWIRVGADDAFGPNDPVTMTEVHRALALAKGLRPAVRGLDRIRTADGTRIRVPSSFGTTVIGMRMELRYPSQYEDHDVHPWTPMPRSQVAYSLWIAATEVGDGTVAYLNQQYDNVELPPMRDRSQEIVEWGVRYAGYPYVWGGEWGLRSRSPLGGQSIPGFDCSGLVWWLMRRNDGGAWKVAPPRPYRGWSLPERTSATMAGATRERLNYRELRPGDLMFYDGSGDGVVDHVDLYVGNGWALDSSTSQGGVTLMWVGDGSWYQEHFRYGRRIVS